MRRALVVAQVGLAVMLLIGAGLLIRSFGELTRVRLGFDPGHVLTAQLRASGDRYDSSTAVNRFYEGGAEAAAAAPAAAAPEITGTVKPITFDARNLGASHIE